MGGYPTRPRRLAIVPARGGSKELPGKNLAVIAGESLLARAVKCADASGAFDLVLVSTDDPAIAEEGRRAGAAVPFLRPVELATDAALVSDAMLDALARLTAGPEGAFHLVALLEPTSPMRTPEIVRRVVAAAESPGVDAALTISEVPLQFNPRKQFTLDEAACVHFAVPDGAQVINRQALSASWVRNGLCYAVRVDALRASRSILGSAARGVIVPGPIVNIDQPADLARARRLLDASGG